jgi:hypothetical protein
MSRLISLSGYPGSGKDTIYDLLTWEVPSIQKLKFAYGIQDIVCMLAGTYESNLEHRELFENRTWKETAQYFPSDYKFTTPRKAAQTIGQGMRELVSDTIWIDKVRRERSESNKNVLVITDTRHENEVDYVRSVGGLVVFVDRPKAEADTKQNPVFNHVSEQYLETIREKADLIIDNSGTYEDLIVTVRNNLLALLGK